MDKLKDLSLYQVNYIELAAKNRQVVSFVSFTSLIYNLIKIYDALPLKLSLLDRPSLGDKWYPLYRTLPFNLKLIKNKNKYLNHFKKSLDTIRERYGVTCGVSEN